MGVPLREVLKPVLEPEEPARCKLCGRTVYGYVVLMLRTAGRTVLCDDCMVDLDSIFHQILVRATEKRR